LGKLNIQRAQQDAKAGQSNSGIKKSKNRAGIVETKVPPCAECHEEFCGGLSCKEFTYESFARVITCIFFSLKSYIYFVQIENDVFDLKREGSAGNDRKSRKKKKKKKGKGKKRKRSKSKGKKGKQDSEKPGEEETAIEVD